jgi:glycosyltransferase involved in cell wall biosynthesis
MGRRILHVFRSPLGGLFRHVLDLARGQSERGHKVGLVCDTISGSARADAALAALEPQLALGILRIAMRRNPHPLDVAVVAAVGRHARRLGAEILHGHGSKGGAYARLAVRGSHGPAAVRVYTPHGGSLHYQPGTVLHRIYMSAERLLARRTDLLLFESDYARQRFERFVGTAPCPARVVHNGVAPAEFEPVSPAADAADILFVGELRALKGIDVLIEAVAALRDRGGGAPTLLIVGSGPDEAALRQQVGALGLAPSTTFSPPLPIRTAFAMGRVMVVPSRAESLPYVVLEAAAAGVPLVATRVGGIPEIFGEQADRLVAPGDYGALAGALAQILARSDPERRAEAAALRERVRDRFSLDTMVDGVLEGYDAVLAKG